MPNHWLGLSTSHDYAATKTREQRLAALGWSIENEGGYSEIGRVGETLIHNYM
jgi:hypothetical protein